MQAGIYTVRQGRSVATLLPIMAAVFVAYLVIGLAMPVLPVHVHQGLGLSTSLWASSRAANLQRR